jgi:hypothetical protein
MTLPSRRITLFLWTSLCCSDQRCVILMHKNLLCIFFLATYLHLCDGCRAKSKVDFELKVYILLIAACCCIIHAFNFVNLLVSLLYVWLHCICRCGSYCALKFYRIICMSFQCTGIVLANFIWCLLFRKKITCFKYVAPNGKDIGSLKFLEQLCHWFIPNPSILWCVYCLLWITKCFSFQYNIHLYISYRDIICYRCNARALT